MLLAEKHQILLLNNSEARPPGTAPIPHKPEVQYNTSNQNRQGSYRPRGTFTGSQGRFAGWGWNQPYRGRGGGRPPISNTSSTGNWRSGTDQIRGRGGGRGRWNKMPNRDKITDLSQCFRCGTKGHIRKECRAPTHLVKLYQESIDSTNTAPQGNYLELNEDLAQYSNAPPSPEIHIITYGSNIAPLDDPTMCIINSQTSHSILWERKYYKHINPSQTPMTTITGKKYIKNGHGPTTVILHNGTPTHFPSAIYVPLATRNLLSFRDIRANNLHIHTTID